MKTRSLLLWFLVVLAIIGIASAVHARSQAELRKLFESATAGDVQAFSVLEKEAKAGDIIVQNLLGMMYGNGTGVRKDLQKAAFWFTQAANGGLPDAQFNLGQMYREGVGVGQNYKVAVEWYERAAAQNHPIALYSLAGMYINGDGVRQDNAEAKRLLERAASLGHAGAKQTLSSLPDSSFSGGPKTQSGSGDTTVYKAGPSPMSALEECEKGCVAFYEGRWICLTREEISSLPYEGSAKTCIESR